MFSNPYKPSFTTVTGRGPHSNYRYLNFKVFQYLHAKNHETCNHVTWKQQKSWKFQFRTSFQKKKLLLFASINKTTHHSFWTRGVQHLAGYTPQEKNHGSKKSWCPRGISGSTCSEPFRNLFWGGVVFTMWLAVDCSGLPILMELGLFAYSNTVDGWNLGCMKPYKSQTTTVWMVLKPCK